MEYNIKVATAEAGPAYEIYAEVSATTNAFPVKNLKARVLGATSIKVEWTTPAKGPVEFKVLAEAASSPPLVVFTKYTSVTFRHLAPEKEYTIKVATGNVVNGRTTYGGYVEVNATTNAIHPALKYLQANFVNDTSLNVTWSTAHVGNIHISVCPVSPSKKNCAVYTTNGDSLQYHIEVVGHDTAYEVRAKLSTLLGYVPCYHDESSVTVKRPATDPVVQNLTAKVLDETSVKVEWTARPGGAAEYKVSAVAEHAPPAIVFTKDTSVTFRQLVPKKKYTIRVTTMNGVTPDARYAEVNVTTDAI
ncbi:hypothetical protein MTO96_039486, partial [Rhipicephalus appendiculatus]